MAEPKTEIIKDIETVLDVYDILDGKVFNSNNLNNKSSEKDNLNSSDIALIETFEGKEKLMLHINKERDPYFMKKCKEYYKTKDKNLSCEICGFSFYGVYGEIGKDFIEGHHTKPISELREETKINISDILFVCSNCHRMIHRENPPLTGEQLKKLIHPNQI